MIQYARQLKAGRLNPYGFVRIVKMKRRERTHLDWEWTRNAFHRGGFQLGLDMAILKCGRRGKSSQAEGSKGEKVKNV